MTKGDHHRSAVFGMPKFHTLFFFYRWITHNREFIIIIITTTIMTTIITEIPAGYPRIRVCVRGKFKYLANCAWWSFYLPHTADGRTERTIKDSRPCRDLVIAQKSTRQDSLIKIRNDCNTFRGPSSPVHDLNHMIQRSHTFPIPRYSSSSFGDSPRVK